MQTGGISVNTNFIRCFLGKQQNFPDIYSASD